MSGVIMECEELLLLKNSEIAALQEELQRERTWRMALQEESDLTFAKLVHFKQENDAMKAKIDSWIAIAERDANMRQQLERQGYEE